MAPKKDSKDKVVSVKGSEAEEMVLAYLKKVNRPLGSTDISANLKNKVSKAIAQKALVTLAEKGKLTRKDYGKQTVFVYPQTAPPPGSASLADLEAELQVLNKPIDDLKKRVKSLQSELHAIETQPSIPQLETQIQKLEKSNADSFARLEGLRAGENPISPEDLAQVDVAWQKGRKEWKARKTVYLNVLEMMTGEMSKTQILELEEELGLEPESQEAKDLLAGPLCKIGGRA